MKVALHGFFNDTFYFSFYIFIVIFLNVFAVSRRSPSLFSRPIYSCPQPDRKPLYWGAMAMDAYVLAALLSVVAIDNPII